MKKEQITPEQLGLDLESQVLKKYCSKCGKEKTYTRQLRPDRKRGWSNRWDCFPCKHKQIAECNRLRRYGSKDLTPIGQIIEEQRGWTKAEKERAKRVRAHGKRVATQGWTRWTFNKYGVTQQQYLEMLERQGYKCGNAGCDFTHRHEEYFSRPPAKGGVAKGESHHLKYLLVVDHCHETGQVRGLLCHRCNIALGLVEELKARGADASFREYLAS